MSNQKLSAKAGQLQTARFGRRNFYVASLALFTVSSFLCGTASSIGQLVLYRVIQGIGGGALQPTAQAILMESYPLEKRAGAMAMFGLGAMVGPAIGPALGGYFIDNYSWPLIFYVNVPIGIVAVIMTMAYIRDPRYVHRDKSPIDVVALTLLTIWLASLQYVLQEGQRLDWFSDQTIVTLTIISVAAMTAFVIRELRDPHPLVDLRIFRWQSFSAGNLISVVSGFGLYGDSADPAVVFAERPRLYADRCRPRADTGVDRNHAQPPGRVARDAVPRRASLDRCWIGHLCSRRVVDG
jgi:MFS transporter, DHA2 family, multidrug resistance protein